MNHQCHKSPRNPVSQSVKDPFSKRNGFSLIEVLIAMVLFAVGMLGLGGMQLISIRGNAFSQKITQATVLTQNKLEELKRLPFVDSSLSIGRHDEGVLGSSTFSRSYDVEDVSTTLKVVTVTVRWTEEIDHSISLSTMKAK
jgi:prepilin-type N-terminal cleavage/methylation domain-containing protein